MTHTYDVLKISIDELKRDYRSFTEAKQRVHFLCNDYWNNYS